MITEITEYKNMDILNKHNNAVFKKQVFWLIKNKKGESFILDMLANKDITDIDYLEILKTNKTKVKTLFKDEFEI